jgi:hypothetical protein
LRTARDRVRLISTVPGSLDNYCIEVMSEDIVDANRTKRGQETPASHTHNYHHRFYKHRVLFFLSAPIFAGISMGFHHLILQERGAAATLCVEPLSHLQIAMTSTPWTASQCHRWRFREQTSEILTDSTQSLGYK